MIDCSNVRFTYDGERFVLRGIDLHIADGEFVCILGGNGSGKSTLAKHMNALLVPDEGCVRVAGHDTQDEEYVYDIRSTGSSHRSWKTTWHSVLKTSASKAHTLPSA